MRQSARVTPANGGVYGFQMALWRQAGAPGDMGLAHLVIANQEVKHRPTKGRFRHATAGRTPQYVGTDQGRLQKVLDNIAANALKYAPDGVVEIKIEALEHDEKDALNHPGV